MLDMVHCTLVHSRPRTVSRPKTVVLTCAVWVQEALPPVTATHSHCERHHDILGAPERTQRDLDRDVIMDRPTSLLREHISDGLKPRAF